MALVFVGARGHDIQRVALLDAIPYRARPLDPCVVVEIVLDRLSIVTRFFEDDDVVCQGRAAHDAVFVELREQQSDGVRANGLGLGIFVNADFAVVNPAAFLKCPDDIAAKVLHADMAICRFRRGQLLDVYAGVAARLGDAQQFIDDE